MRRALNLAALLAVLIFGVLVSLLPITIHASNLPVSISLSRANAQLQRYSGPTTVTPTAWGYLYQLSNGDTVEVGSNPDPEFRAHIKTTRYDNVAWFSLSQPGTYTPTLNGLTVSFPFNANVNVSIYPVEANERLPEGGIEYNIIMLRRPAQFTVSLNIDWQGITWRKIPPLTSEYDQARCTELFGAEAAPFIITATSIVGSDGVTYKTRAEYEVNSYIGEATAPHKDTKEFEGGVSYTTQTRTYLYIHRGQMTDAVGNKAWVEDINIDQTAKTITFTLPRTWLRDTAVYPVQQVVGVDPAYTQKMESWTSMDWTDPQDNQWRDYDIYTAKSVPKGAVAEIVMSNATAGTENTLGVRTDGSAITRLVTLHEAEGGGQTHARMFATVHASTGLIECVHSDVSDADYFYLVGYWTNVTFTETTPSQIVLTTVSNWEDTTLSAGASAIHHIHMTNASALADTSVTVGARANGSSLSRSIKLHEAEAGGNSVLDLLVKADASRIIDLYQDNASYFGVFWDYGYFGTEMDFVENWVSNQGIDAWADWDVTAYLDVDGRMADFMLVHSAEAATATMGVRGGDDNATARTLVEHEAESAGAGGEYTGFSMSALTNATGIVHVELPATTTYAYYTGYFKPAVVYDISNSPSSEALGTLAVSTSYYAKGSAPSNPVQDGECTFTLTNNGAAAIDLDMHLHDFTGGVGWNIEEAGAPGADEVKVTAYYSGQDPAAGLWVKNADAEFYDALAAAAHIHWDFKLETGSSFTDGVAKSGTLTITAVAED